MFRRKRIYEANAEQTLRYVMSQIGEVVFSVDQQSRDAKYQVEEMVDAIKRNADVLSEANDRALANAFRLCVLSVVEELENGIREY